jgi:hypothetical protein
MMIIDRSITGKVKYDMIYISIRDDDDNQLPSNVVNSSKENIEHIEHVDQQCCWLISTRVIWTHVIFKWKQSMNCKTFLDCDDVQRK